jgi:L-iditol 2-dehydrogenase
VNLKGIDMNGKMLAAMYYGKGDVRIEHVAIPKPSPGEVLVRVFACGICGSDHRLFQSGPAGAKMDPWPIPRILGHEFTGEVVTVGKGVEGFNPGDHVAAAPATYCDECFHCERGEYTLCLSPIDFGSTHPGAFSEYVLVPGLMVRQGGLIKMDKNIPAIRAIFLEPLGTCLRGLLTKGNLTEGESVVIIGDGPIGLIQVMLAVYQRAANVICVGHHDTRLAQAKSFGAHHTINSNLEDITQFVKNNLDGFGVDLVVVSAPSTSAIVDGLKMVRNGGRAVLFGGVPRGSAITIDPNTLHYGETSFIGSYNCTIDEANHASKLLKVFPFEHMITHRYPLGQADHGFRVHQKKQGIKTVIEM